MAPQEHFATWRGRQFSLVPQNFADIAVKMRLSGGLKKASRNAIKVTEHWCGLLQMVVWRLVLGAAV